MGIFQIGRLGPVNYNSFLNFWAGVGGLAMVLCSLAHTGL